MEGGSQISSGWLGLFGSREVGGVRLYDEKHGPQQHAGSNDRDSGGVFPFTMIPPRPPGDLRYIGSATFTGVRRSTVVPSPSRP